MGILAEDVERVRATADIVAVVSQYTPLRRVGRSFTGLCPFHNEKTPSFSVNMEKGLYYCFGCQAGGDVIRFVQQMEHTDFVGAVERLAARAGITLRYTDRDEGEAHRRRKRLLDAVEEAVAHYHDRLLTSPDAGPARSYLRSRGFDGDTVRHYRLGWAPDSWDSLARRLRLPDDEWRDSGLGAIGKGGRQYDHFRNRVLFPIFDPSGRAIGFGGRILPGADGPKYKNTPDCAVYHKSRVLYGLNWAGAEAARRDEIVVCEGYTDVIAFHRAGVERAVATCGTALTEEHVRELTRYAKRVVLAFDADSAGQAAAARFYEWEREYEIEVAVAALPAGVDPADLGRDDPAALAESVDEARPFLEFRVERLFASRDLRTAEGRARAAEAAVELVGQHPSELVRDQYLMRIADRCQIDVDRLRSVLAGSGRGPAGRSGPRERRGQPAGRAPSAGRGPQVAPVERQVLALLVHGDEGASRLVHRDLFASAVAAAAVDELRAAGGDVLAAMGAATPAVSDLLNQAAVEEPDDDPLPTLTQLVVDAARRRAGELEAEARAEPSLFAENTRASHWLRQEADRLWTLREARHLGLADLEPLVAWLESRDDQPDSEEGERADG